MATSSFDKQEYAIRTWRYLRVAMIVLIIGLLVAVLYERANAPGCFQKSISAYYYTPVHGVLVGALVAVGACLICLEGNTPGEDALLNLAGVFAPVVAFVPTSDPGTCFSIAAPAENRDANVSNNVFALLVVGGVALAIAAALALRAHFADDAPLPEPAALAGFAGAGLIWIVALVLFNAAHSFFVEHAHYTAAILMFVCFWFVVVINAVEYGARYGRVWIIDRYGLIALIMLADAAGLGIAGGLGFGHWLIWLEATQIGLFAVFWGIQSRELWGEGIR
jgi:hypothetical protein